MLVRSVRTSAVGALCRGCDVQSPAPFQGWTQLPDDGCSTGSSCGLRRWCGAGATGFGDG